MEFKGFVRLLGIGAIALLMVGCGGSSDSGENNSGSSSQSGGNTSGGTDSGSGTGGEGSDTIPTESEFATITDENSQDVVEAVFGSMEIADGFEDGPSLDSMASVESTPLLKNIKIPALTKVLSSAVSLKTIAESTTVECAAGGSFLVDGSETGATITYDNCIQDGITIDGTLAFTVSNEGKSGTLTYTNFSVIHDENNKVFYSSVTGAYSFNDSFVVTDLSITMNGYVIVSGKRTDLEDYKLVLTVDGNDNMSFTINGSLKSDCLGGWIKMKTNEAMVVNASGDCPSTGQIVVTGSTSNLTITFNADGSVDISGSANKHYDSCEDLDSGVCSI